MKLSGFVVVVVVVLGDRCCYYILCSRYTGRVLLLCTHHTMVHITGGMDNGKFTFFFFCQDNAVLYCIGDLNVDETEEQIRQMFGHLGGVPDRTVRDSKQGEKILHIPVQQ